MRRTHSDRKMLIYCGTVISAAVIILSSQSPTEQSKIISVAVPSATVDSQEGTKINPGSAGAAIAYYHKTLTEVGLNEQNLSAAALVGSMKLSQVMAHLGYPDLDLKDIEDLPSAELMKRHPGDILSSVYFAPKITDVSVTPINPGWRKLVRFKAKGKALEKGISAGYLLFNKFQLSKFQVANEKPDYDRDPFGDKSNESENTQLILVRGSRATLEYPIYFLVFSQRSGSSRLMTYLNATFDARAPNIVSDNRYYVPHACAECHGGLIKGPEPKPAYERLKLNYLDTDHWFDRLEDDFAVLKKSTCGGKKRPCPMLYDGHNDNSEFEQAFNVIRELNSEIEAQNKSVQPSDKPLSFQLRAVTKWLELHKTDSRHKDVFARALPPATSGDPWKADNKTDKQLLPLLNRYCYRCHSSLKFSVFDRPRVAGERDQISDYMTRAIDDPMKMPQDRNLDCSAFDDKKRILELVQSLPTPTPSPTP